MKKFLLSLSGAFAFINFAMAQIPNNSFETWTNMGAYDVPAGWGTMNNTTASYSVFTATKATPGNPGNAYLKLTSRSTGTFVTNGIAVSGVLDSNALKPKSGFAYTQRPASFSGRWQHMIYGSSQGGIRVLTTKWNSANSKRDTIAHAETTLSGMAMSWANFNMNLVYTDSTNYPDSCIIVMQASGSNPTNNDYLWVDNLAFTGTVAVVVHTVSTVGIQHLSAPVNACAIFPNPAHDYCQINISLSQAQNLQINVYDAAGKLCRSLHKSALSGENVFSIDTKSFNSGNYLIEIKGDSFIENKKLIID